MTDKTSSTTQIQLFFIDTKLATMEALLLSMKHRLEDLTKTVNLIHEKFDIINNSEENNGN